MRKTTRLHARSAARSWGKVGEEARSVTVYADATITLPIIVAAARSRLGE